MIVRLPWKPGWHGPLCTRSYGKLSRSDLGNLHTCRNVFLTSAIDDWNLLITFRSNMVSRKNCLTLYFLGNTPFLLSKLTVFFIKHTYPYHGKNWNFIVCTTKYLIKYLVKLKIIVLKYKYVMYKQLNKRVIICRHELGVHVLVNRHRWTLFHDPGSKSYYEAITSALFYIN